MLYYQNSRSKEWQSTSITIFHLSPEVAAFAKIHQNHLDYNLRHTNFPEAAASDGSNNLTVKNGAP